MPTDQLSLEIELTIEERLNAIFDEVKNLAPAVNFNEAFSQLQVAFWHDTPPTVNPEDDENKQRRPLMFCAEHQLATNDHFNFRMHAFKKHALLIGENGAIEVYHLASFLQAVVLGNFPLVAKNKLKPYFIKPGADNKDVWTRRRDNT